VSLLRTQATDLDRSRFIDQSTSGDCRVEKRKYASRWCFSQYARGR